MLTSTPKSEIRNQNAKFPNNLPSLNVSVIKDAENQNKQFREPQRPQSQQSLEILFRKPTRSQTKKKL